MKIRPFTIDDAQTIISWSSDKLAFRKWSADRYESYPPKPEDMVAQYDADNITPFVATDDEGKLVGHFMLRRPGTDKQLLRIGFVIVDNALRGKGIGRQMMLMAIDKAKEMGARKVSLGVFDNNPSAMRCYESVGFIVTHPDSYEIDGEVWTEKEMEIEL